MPLFRILIKILNYSYKIYVITIVYCEKGSERSRDQSESGEMNESLRDRENEKTGKD